MDYDAIYKSEKEIEDTPSSDIENTPSESEDTPKGNIDNTHNNINTKITPNNKNENNITVNYPKARDNFTNENGTFKF